MARTKGNERPEPEDQPLRQTIDHALSALDVLLGEAQAAQQAGVPDAPVHDSYRASAENFLAYLALRRRDIRPLQRSLAALGLSSLGRLEACTLPALRTVRQVLARLAGEQSPLREDACLDRAEASLAAHAEALLGALQSQRDVRIMVTMPSEAARSYALVRDLLATGMDCMRINCAHDTPRDWLRMIRHLRRAEAETGRRCRVMMDLAGPKLRTGMLEAGPAVRRVKPQRNALGQVTEPARVWLTDAEQPDPPPGPAAATFGVSGDWLAERRDGERLRLKDARRSRRKWQVVEARQDGCWVELDKTAYVVPGLALRAKGGGKTRVADFPPSEQAIHLAVGDSLWLTRDASSGGPAEIDAQGHCQRPARIGCTLPQVLDDLEPGQPIWFDDGKIGGEIEALEPDQVRVRITHAQGKAKLRADKGINLPHSRLRLPALSDEDRAALKVAVRRADAVEFSFVNEVADIEALHAELDRLGAPDFGVVLKIETRRGFENLPRLLLAGMRRPCFGVMIARGDLAVEGGFERLAELQEEILCLCEAAHVPVIWATQVLETLAKKGAPSRAEITDAAMGVRAECVMLNKGPHILDAVRTLDDLLLRMRDHQQKKRDLLRPLRVAEQLADNR